MKKGIFFILIIVVTFILIFSGCNKEKSDDFIKKAFQDLSPTESLFLITLVIICVLLVYILKSLDLSELKQIKKQLSDLKILKESELKQITNLLSDLVERNFYSNTR